MTRSPQESERLLTDMVTAQPESAALRGRLGLLYQSTGREHLALAEFCAAFEVAPNDTVGRYNYAAALHAAGDHALSLELLDEGLLTSPDNFRLHYGRACSLQSTGLRDDARIAYMRAVELQADFADGWYAIGTLEQAEGHHAAAIECYQKVVALQPENLSAQHMLDSLIGQQSSQAPGEFAKILFDSYADHYEEHLTGTLEYRGPELVEGALLKCLGSRTGLRVLDLGCGTGLFGERIRSLADQLTGIDVSANMIAKTEERGDYDAVFVAELHDYLQTIVPGSFDVIVAIDVFIYLGSLSDVVVGCAKALDKNGLLAFSAEIGAKGFQLDHSGRYTHSENYLSEQREQAGFESLSFTEETIRQESGEPCRAFIGVWRRPPE
jgi:predicted TPR repeat methyltransferase